VTVADLLYLGDELINTSALTDAQLLDELYRRGFKLARKCICCGKWLNSQPIPRDGIGPACRRRLDAQTGAP
jgi:hypothetical protein